MTVCRVDLEQSTITVLACPACHSADVDCYPPEDDPTGLHPPALHLHECGDCGYCAWFDDEGRTVLSAGGPLT